MDANDLKRKKKPELMALAKQVGLKVTARMTKAQMLSALTLHYTAKRAGQAAAKQQKHPARPPAQQPAAAPAAAAGRAAQRPAAPAAPPPAATAAAPAALEEVPSCYHEDRMVLMVRDPYWLHAYWELSGEAMGRARQYFGPRWKSVRLVLRVYDVTDVQFSGRNARSFFDIEVSPEATNWYINVPAPDRSYCADIALLGAGSDLFMLARSNTVQAPRAGLSEVVDEKWAARGEELAALYAHAGSERRGLGSLELRELMERRFREELASGVPSSLASLAMKREQARGFRFLVEAELILYGATEPDATVTVQGQPLRLRPDGTFTLRFALPNGRQIIPAVAASADKLEERTITLAVSRTTEAQMPRMLQRA